MEIFIMDEMQKCDKNMYHIFIYFYLYIQHLFSALYTTK